MSIGKNHFCCISTKTCHKFYLHEQIVRKNCEKKLQESANTDISCTSSSLFEDAVKMHYSADIDTLIFLHTSA